MVHFVVLSRILVFSPEISRAVCLLLVLSRGLFGVLCLAQDSRGS